MQLDDIQARAIAVNAEVLLSIGAKRVVITRCGQCNIPVLSERAGYLIVCGYCGQDTELNHYELVPLWRRILHRFWPLRDTVPA